MYLELIINFKSMTDEMNQPVEETIEETPVVEETPIEEVTSTPE